MGHAEDGAQDAAERAALRRELEGTRERLEEVAAYYRGQLEAARRRSEDEAVRVQAAEAGRRRRAEEQVAYLKGELNDARATSEHAQRRYQELHARLEEADRASAAKSNAAADTEAAKVAWKTAEEEVERLDRELSLLRHELASSHEQRNQLLREYSHLEQVQQRADQERRRLIARLKRAFKLSEQRRRALEAQAAELSERIRAQSADARASPATMLAQGEVEVDPAAGWGATSLGAADDFADEFLMLASDESLSAPHDDGPPTAASAAAHRSGSPAAGEASEAAPRTAEVSDQEAENLIMEMDVDRKLAQRRAHHPAVVAAAVEPPPVAEPAFTQRYRWLLAAGGVATVLALAAALLLFV